MFLATLWFLYVQASVLHAYCRYCLFSAAITFLLAGLVIALPPSQDAGKLKAWRESKRYRRVPDGSRRRGYKTKGGRHFCRPPNANLPWLSRMCGTAGLEFLTQGNVIETITD